MSVATACAPESSAFDTTASLMRMARLSLPAVSVERRWTVFHHERHVVPRRSFKRASTCSWIAC